MDIVCLDLEGVLVPEIWINVAERTRIAELRVTTREMPDYDKLMTLRMGILDQHGLGLPQIQEVIATMDPMPGAAEFLASLRSAYQVLILSDTFYEFAAPLMKKLGLPTLLCHRLVVDGAGKIVGYKLRQVDPKRQAVRALKGLNFRVVAAGDSYNDTSMLSEADAGFLFRAPPNVIREFPQFPHVTEYAELRQRIDSAMG